MSVLLPSLVFPLFDPGRWASFRCRTADFGVGTAPVVGLLFVSVVFVDIEGGRLEAMVGDDDGIEGVRPLTGACINGVAFFSLPAVGFGRVATVVDMAGALYLQLRMSSPLISRLPSRVSPRTRRYSDAYCCHARA